MDDDDQAPAFDDLAVDEPRKTERNLWRLGHRRPWWQWNVLTLFAALFILVWVRELARLPQTISWIACLAILVLWALGPLPLLDDLAIARTPLSELAKSGREPVPGPSLGRVLAVFLAFQMFVGVLYLGGPFAFILALLGAVLMVLATWNRQA